MAGLVPAIHVVMQEDSFRLPAWPKERPDAQPRKFVTFPRADLRGQPWVKPGHDGDPAARLYRKSEAPSKRRECSAIANRSVMPAI